GRAKSAPDDKAPRSNPRGCSQELDCFVATLLAMIPTNAKAISMSNDIVLQHLDNGLLTITMNRPDRRNALSPDMTRGLVEAARRAAEDQEVRAVLLKGAGGTFCVGGDVKSMAAGRAPMSFEEEQGNVRNGMCG